MPNSCPSEVIWLKFLDHEVADQENQTLANHLEECSACQGTFHEVAATAGWTAAAVDEWSRSLSYKPSPMGRVGTWLRSGAGLAASAAVIVIAVMVLALPATRNALAEMINSFQMNHVATVSLTGQEMTQMEVKLDEGGKVNFAHYGSIDTRGASGQSTQVPLSQFSSRSGLPNLWPGALANSKVTALVTPPGKVVFTLNVDAINQLIKEEGGTNFFPQSLNRVPITVNIPESVIISEFDNSTGIGYNLTEAWTPSITVPGPVNKQKIASALVSLPFLPSTVQTTLGTLGGKLQNTMVIPTKGQTSQVTVQGRPGSLIVQSGMSTVVWIRHGILFNFMCTDPGSVTPSQFMQEVHQWFP